MLLWTATTTTTTTKYYYYYYYCCLAAAQACAPPPDAAAARPVGDGPAGDGVQIGKAGPAESTQSTMEPTTWYRRLEE